MQHWFPLFCHQDLFLLIWCGKGKPFSEMSSTSIKKVLFYFTVICSTWYVLKNWTIFSWCCNNLMQKCKVKYANHKHQNQHLNMSIMSSFFFFIENKKVNMQIKVNNISAFSFVLWNKAIRNIRTPVEVM